MPLLLQRIRRDQHNSENDSQHLSMSVYIYSYICIPVISVTYIRHSNQNYTLKCPRKRRIDPRPNNRPLRSVCSGTSALEIGAYVRLFHPK
jgi:hypothetical protein